MLCYVALCCVVLLYVVLCCFMLCCVALCCVMLLYVVLCCIMLCCVEMCWVVLSYGLLCCIVPLSIASQTLPNKVRSNPSVFKADLWRHMLRIQKLIFKTAEMSSLFINDYIGISTTPCTKTVKFLLSEPISFAAVHTYIPLSAFVTSLMVSLPFVSVCVLSLGRIPRTLRHTTTGSGYPVQGHWRDRLLVELIFCLGGLWSWIIGTAEKGIVTSTPYVS